MVDQVTLDMFEITVSASAQFWLSWFY